MINTIAIDNKISEIAKAVQDGLSKTPKRLPSWLFYDEKGDKIFQRIMTMPEYYLTRCEYEILESNKQILLKYFNYDRSPFNLIELGAGDGFKTEILLQHFSKNNVEYIYTPVDVSEAVLRTLRNRLSKNIPNLYVNPIDDSYEDALAQIQKGYKRKVLIFLGANIGNFTIKEAIDFLGKVSNTMSSEDQLLVGFDLKKDPRLILNAYDDPHGITKDFNMNLLLRLNRELNSNFNIDNFSHYPNYNPETGEIKSYLVSKIEQSVYFKRCEKTIHFRQWEVVHTEISQKFDKRMIETLALEAGLNIVRYFYDAKKYFCDVLLKKK